MECDIFMMKMAVKFTPTSYEKQKFIVWGYWIFKTIELHLTTFFHAKINENFTAIKIQAYIYPYLHPMNPIVNMNVKYVGNYEYGKYFSSLFVPLPFFAAINAEGIKRFLHVWDINICNMKIAYHLWILSTWKFYNTWNNRIKKGLDILVNELQFEEQKILEKLTKLLWIIMIYDHWICCCWKIRKL